MTLRDDLEPLIRARGLREVSRQTGIHASAISRWLHGTRRMSDEALELIAQVIGVEIAISPKTRSPEQENKQWVAPYKEEPENVGTDQKARRESADR